MVLSIWSLYHPWSCSCAVRIYHKDVAGTKPALWKTYFEINFLWNQNWLIKMGGGTSWRTPRLKKFRFHRVCLEISEYCPLLGSTSDTYSPPKILNPPLISDVSKLLVDPEWVPSEFLEFPGFFRIFLAGHLTRKILDQLHLDLNQRDYNKNSMFWIGIIRKISEIVHFKIGVSTPSFRFCNICW